MKRKEGQSFEDYRTERTRKQDATREHLKYGTLIFTNGTYRMKCIKHKVGQYIVRVPENTAMRLTQQKGEFEYVSKKEWKEAGRYAKFTKRHSHA